MDDIESIAMSTSYESPRSVRLPSPASLFHELNKRTNLDPLSCCYLYL